MAVGPSMAQMFRRMMEQDQGNLSSSYRVEHHSGDDVAVLGRLDRCFPHHTTLVPFAVHLHLAGRPHGEVLLVDERTGNVVARRDVRRGFQTRRA